MSIFIEQSNELTAESAKALGNSSAAIKTAGTHDLIIKKAFETDGGTWKSFTVNFETPEGETINYMGFFGVAKDTSAEAISKAEAQTNRTMADVSRIAKAAGLPSVKEMAGGAVQEVDSKDRPITVFPKIANKKLIGTTFTSIDGQKVNGSIAPDKVFPKQVLDTFKFLATNGKDGMGRNCREAYDAEAVERIEIAYGYEKNPKHIAKLAMLQEKLQLSKATSNIATGGDAQTAVTPVIQEVSTNQDI
jgi:hypothetical protein